MNELNYIQFKNDVSLFLKLMFSFNDFLYSNLDRIAPPSAYIKAILGYLEQVTDFPSIRNLIEHLKKLIDFPSDGVLLERRSAYCPPLRHHGAHNYPAEICVNKKLTQLYGFQRLQSLNDVVKLSLYTKGRLTKQVVERIRSGVYLLFFITRTVVARRSHLTSPHHLAGLSIFLDYQRKVNFKLTTFKKKYEFILFWEQKRMAIFQHSNKLEP